MGSANIKTLFFALFLLIVIPLSIILWILNVISYTLSSDIAEWRPISPIRWFTSFAIPVYMVVSAVKKKSLNKSGAAAGLLVGILLTLSSACFSAALLTFFITGSKATKFRQNQKKKIEADFKEGGERNWLQVLCNGGVPTQMAVLYIIEAGCGEYLVDFSKRYTTSWLSMSVLGCLASCTGDTWASELGSVVGSSQPHLITTWESVPKGTNGAVSLFGLLVSLVGGAVVGLAYYITLLVSSTQDYLDTGPPQLPIILVAGLCGLIGSIIDSLLGATLQYSGKDKETGCIVETPGRKIEHISGTQFLDNHGVNLLTSLIMVPVAPYVALIVWSYVV